MITDYHNKPEEQYLADNPNIAPFFNDIDKEIAARAFYNTSHRPEVRGASLRAEYAKSLFK